MVPVAEVAVATREVIGFHRETEDTVTLTIEDREARGFLPGQFFMLSPFGIGESAISISGDPGRPGAIEHTIRSVGMVTAALSSLRPGDRVGARGPYGVGWPMEAATGGDLVVVAGGIGLAPLRSVVRQVIGARHRFRRVAVLIGARAPSELLFQQEIHEWRGRFDLDVHVTVDSADASWMGPIDVVTRLIPRMDVDPAKSVAMVCGPEVMMRFAAADLERLGISSDRIYVSMERNMQCAVGVCGHCQMGPFFICKDGPVLPYSRIAPYMGVRET
ncbi:MAG: Ni/Fe hydrogenase subunit gamma [Actinobacteria bacterium RBG_16_68_21]|nr:MAG: Ni/Fe hydrogenase subunit gamma [Actinobacteria bacterium RBG_16_68_21]